MTTQNFWPPNIAEPIDADEEGPLKLLRQQAEFLSEMTDGMVSAQVTNLVGPEKGMFLSSFYLTGPEINFQYLLFSIHYPPPPAPFYPAHLSFDLEPNLAAVGGPMIVDEADLEKHLTFMFNHAQTRQVIGAIIARSK